MTGGTAELGTRSVLFTDVVGSTEQRSALGDDAADQLQRVHDELVCAAIAQAGGTVVKGLGDGVMATFGAAADAVAAAVGIQQAVERDGRMHPERAFAVRVGISIGDVTVENDDVFGTPVVEAARLCAAATGGEILVAELTRLLARGRGGFVFEPVGDLELKGLPEPVASCRVTWEPIHAPVSGGDGVPLPPMLTSTPATSYVGRPELIAALDEAWGAVAGGGVRTMLLAGEPGVGKTRTAAEAARRAFEHGAVVLFGRCDEDLGVPYQPFVEALEWYVRHTDAPALGRLPGELTRLVPELPQLVPGLPAPVASDPRSEEYRLFEAVTSWLVDASEANGLVLLLDDLHWAARPTLQLLLHALQGAASAGGRLLTLATYRDTDVDRAHPLAGMLSDLRRLPGVERHAVGGLNEAEVIELVETAAGHQLDDEARQLAATVYGETDGNPFFVSEILRHLVESGGVRRVDDRWVVNTAAVAVPEGVRDVVGRRVSRLSSAANSVLSVAAVIGPDVPLEVLLAVVDVPEDDVLDALDAAVRARLLEETGADRYRFAHALVRTTLYDELSATRQRRLHRRVADVIEKLHPDDVVALAHHTLHAGPDGGDSSRAASYSIAAGEQALQARAVADAEARFRQALELLEESDFPDEHLTLRAHCGLGEAQRDQGDPAYRATLFTAAHRARAAGNTAILVRAILANHRGFVSIVSDVDDERIELLEHALDALGEQDSPERAFLLAQLASELVYAADEYTRRRGLAAEAAALASRLGDPATTVEVFNRSAWASIGVDDLDDYLARSEEAVGLADALGDPTSRVLARLNHQAGLMAAGRLDEARTSTAEMVEAAADTAPTIRWLARFQAIRFLISDGDIAAASRENDACSQWGAEMGEPDAANWWAAAVSGISYFAGTGAALADMAGEFAERYPKTQVWTVAHAWLLAWRGDAERAREVLARPDIDIEVGMREPFPFVAAMQFAAVAYLLGDAGLAEQARQVMAPHRGGWCHYWLALFGPVNHGLARCAIALGEVDEAVELFEAALAESRSARCWAVADVVALELGAALQQRDAPGDRDRIVALAGEVLEHTRRSGAIARQAEAEALLAAVS